MSNYLSQFFFASPWWLLLLGVIPFLIYLFFLKKNKTQPTWTFSDIAHNDLPTSWKVTAYKYLPILPLLGLTCLIVALARPQLALTEEKITADGIDIMLVMDMSSSMLSRDFNPDRLQVSKKVAQDFVGRRIHDRIGLVAFAGEAYTQCPLTMDHNLLMDFIAQLDVGMVEDGTAIGMGLATAVNRIKDSESKSKIIILLTDGVNNAGYIAPMTAAEIAATLGVKVYTVAVGSMGNALSPINRLMNGKYIFGMARVEIDVELLKNISDMTGGQFYRATDNESLEKIYYEIDQLEKTEIEVEVFKRYKDEFRRFLVAGIFLILFWWLLRQTIFKVYG